MVHAQAIVMSKGHTGVKRARVQYAYMSTALPLYCTWFALKLTPHLCPLSKVQSTLGGTTARQANQLASDVICVCGGGGGGGVINRKLSK